MKTRNDSSDEECKKNCGMSEALKNDLWESDLAQFARLLSALDARGVGFNADDESLIESISLPPFEAETIWYRALDLWSRFKKDPWKLLQAGGGWYDPDVCAVGYTEFSGRSFTDLIKEILKLRDQNKKLNELLVAATTKSEFEEHE